ncbi:hypothetical protein [Streptomyces sp. NRRL B-1347]|uniref:hypothetical protein n=1 Tax=Streptomyces sp. NRRL B-1347 TaxID=1476877 RepID=UPI00068EC210|nr:hypothetical protein [Streptomyces sp. NRRL B-1347]
MPDAPAFDFPRDLIEEQHVLADLSARYTALCARLPWAAEPHEGWDDSGADHRWLRSSRAASKGYEPADAAELEELREALREKAAAVITHPYWGQLSGADVVKARIALKYAPLPERAGAAGMT